MIGRLEYKWIVGIVLIFGLFMELLDMTITNVALPVLGRDLDVDPDSGATILQWVVTGYLLSLAVFIPVSGWAGDHFGTKRVFLFALAVFTLSSMACGLAWSIESLIAFRVLQGIGGGMLTPVGTAMLFRAFPPIERAKAGAILIIPVAVAPATGPVLGGYLVEYLDWRWIFFVNIPIGVLFLARLYGIDVSAAQLLTIALTTVLTTFSVPGIPGGSIIVMVPVLLAANLPVEGIGILLGVDTLPDMFRTTTNVTGDMAVASLLTRSEATAARPMDAL